MNILSLRYFLKIAEHGSITRAAAELHITQPALTRHVAHLEDQLRVKLLMRHGRGVRLTEPGRLLTTRARSILADIDILSEELLARQTEPQGELSVGLPWSWSEGITAPVVKRFNELYPEVRLNVIADSSETLEGMLKSQYLDFAVLTMVEDDPEIDPRPVRSEEHTSELHYLVPISSGWTSIAFRRNCSLGRRSLRENSRWACHGRGRRASPHRSSSGSTSYTPKSGSTS